MLLLRIKQFACGIMFGSINVESCELCDCCYVYYSLEMRDECSEVEREEGGGKGEGGENRGREAERKFIKLDK